MELKPFFCYYGGKWRAAPHYPAPTYPDIVEPFAGAAGYATRYHARAVTLYDADPVIAGLWAYLIRVTAAEIRSLPNVPLEGTVDDVACCQEAKWLIGFWLNGGSSVPKKRPSAWMRRAASGTRGGSLCWGQRVRDRLATQVEYIRHWRVFNKPYAQAEPVTATWYVDPPYQGRAGSFYRVHDVDYMVLAAWCKGLRGQVMVCENAGADWLPFKPFRTIRGSSGKHRSGKSVEVLWAQTTEEW